VFEVKKRKEKKNKQTFGNVFEVKKPMHFLVIKKPKSHRSVKGTKKKKKRIKYI
jgi:hypothetical protein